MSLPAPIFLLSFPLKGREMARSLEATSDRFHNAAGKPKNIPVLFIQEEGVHLLNDTF